MDELLDKCCPSVSNREKPFDFEEWCREIDQHPAFLKELKSGEGGEFSAEVQAIQALKYDEEDDPSQCALAYKEEGNRHFSKAKYRWAIGAYTKGIQLLSAAANGQNLELEQQQLLSVLYANRAAANRHLGNLRSAVRDCIFARRFQADNFKAILRGAECLLELGRAVACIKWIDASIGQEDGAKLLAETERRKLEDLREAAERRRVLEERDERKRRVKTLAETRQKQRLLEALKQRGTRHRPPIDDDLTNLQVSFGQLDKIVSVHLAEDEDQLVWPLLLQYPEVGQTDFVEHFPEHAPVGQVLGDVFESPAEWDAEHKFSFNKVRLFIPLDSADDRQERVREVHAEDTLACVLAWPDVFIQRGLPVLQVYTREHVHQQQQQRNSFKAVEGVEEGRMRIFQLR